MSEWSPAGSRRATAHPPMNNVYVSARNHGSIPTRPSEFRDRVASPPAGHSDHGRYVLTRTTLRSDPVWNCTGPRSAFRGPPYRRDIMSPSSTPLKENGRAASRSEVLD